MIFIHSNHFKRMLRDASYLPHDITDPRTWTWYIDFCCPKIVTDHTTRTFFTRMLSFISWTTTRYTGNNDERKLTVKTHILRFTLNHGKLLSPKLCSCGSIPTEICTYTNYNYSCKDNNGSGSHLRIDEKLRGYKPSLSSVKTFEYHHRWLPKCCWMFSLCRYSYIFWQSDLSL